MKKKILVIEDEAMHLDSYAEILVESGFEVLKAIDGYKGLEMLETHKDNLSLVILDLMMPGLDGLEVLRIKNDNPEKYGKLPVLVLTNLTSERVVKEAFDIGAVSFLVKTEMDAQALVEAVRKVVKEV
jgi:two-component system, sensor histidine kinase ChiS